jgi:hypothetical protein
MPPVRQEASDEQGLEFLPLPRRNSTRSPPSRRRQNRVPAPIPRPAMSGATCRRVAAISSTTPPAMPGGRTVAVMRSFPAHDVDCGSRADPEWETYCRFFYPSPADHQRIMNRRLCVDLQKHGRRPVESARDRSLGLFSHRCGALGLRSSSLASNGAKTATPMRPGPTSALTSRASRCRASGQSMPSSCRWSTWPRTLAGATTAEMRLWSPDPLALRAPSTSPPALCASRRVRSWWSPLPRLWSRLSPSWRLPSRRLPWPGAAP